MLSLALCSQCSPGGCNLGWANEAKWAAGTCLLLALVQAVYFLYSGWGRIDVATGSETVTIGYSATNVIVASLVLAAFNCGIVLAATREQSRRDSDRDIAA